MATGEDLPSEIIEDILHRLPVKSLVRFKCVSKAWNSLISEYNKTLLHRNRIKLLILHLDPDSIRHLHPKQSLHSIDLPERNPYLTDELAAVELSFFPKLNSRLEVFHGSCNGLVLAVDTNHDAFLLNPTIGEFRKLPSWHLDLNHHLYSPCINDCSYGLGYDSTTDDYKVVVAYVYDFYFSFDFVYSLRNNRWKSLEDLQDGFEGQTDKECSCGIFINGHLHWLLYVEDWSAFVGRFSLADERSADRFLLPKYWQEDTYEEKEGVRQLDIQLLYNFGGFLCFVVFADYQDTYIWVMKEYGITESWTNIHICDPNQIAGMPICLLGDEEILFWGIGEEEKRIISFQYKYNVVPTRTQGTRFRSISLCGVPESYEDVGIYIESLISPNNHSTFDTQYLHT